MQRVIEAAVYNAGRVPRHQLHFPARYRQALFGAAFASKEVGSFFYSLTKRRFEHG